ncbi:DNA protecting protein DprA [Acinetobacter dispersus]|uniref:DNA-processing protein DprA n=1 Tax=Acinetobacter dispersus TaxID=70348 RepID=UPI0002CED9B8|nr:DNA-processing protein DprA [Acinetobacter dispersus]ENX53564.1 DNA protecting protein DprA [Acinetobacter dispersus]
MVKEIHPYTYKLLALSFLEGIGRFKLFSLIKSATNFDKSIEELSFILTKKANSSIELIIQKANQQVELNQKYNGNIYSPFDDEYPSYLKELDDSPIFLFCRGNTELLNTNNLAIIGTRNPTVHGEILNKKLTQWFTNQNWTIVSGLALGHDSIAHKECLRNNGKTLAVLAHGLDTVYPKSNTDLANSILEKGGLLVSEYPYLTALFKSNLVQRDRIQAGLAKGVVLVQSSTEGGSLYASNSILKYQRYLIVVNQSKSDIRNNEKNISANMNIIQKNSGEIEKMFGKNYDSKLILELNQLDDFKEIQNKLLDHTTNSNSYTLNLI